MIPLLHVLTLLFIIGCIVTCIITGYKSDLIAIIAIICCLIYIVSGWIFLFLRGKRGTHRKVINMNNDCIIGSNKKLNGILNGGCIDIWMVCHVLFWILIGLLSPNHWLIIVGLSISWELIEHGVFKYITKRCNSYFCGRVEDIFFNLLGYGIGSMIRLYV